MQTSSPIITPYHQAYRPSAIIVGAVGGLEKGGPDDWVMFHMLNFKSVQCFPTIFVMYRNGGVDNFNKRDNPANGITARSDADIRASYARLRQRRVVRHSDPRRDDGNRGRLLVCLGRARASGDHGEHAQL